MTLFWISAATVALMRGASIEPISMTAFSASFSAATSRYFVLSKGRNVARYASTFTGVRNVNSGAFFDLFTRSLHGALHELQRDEPKCLFGLRSPKLAHTSAYRMALPTSAQNAYTGASPSFVYNAATKVTGTGVDVHTTTPLAMHQGLTVDVAFGKGAVSDPTAFDLIIPFRYNWPLAVLIIAFLITLWWLWWSREKAERQSREKIERIEVKAEKEPEKVKFAWDLASAKLEKYFDGNLRQVFWIFMVAIVVMLIVFYLYSGGFACDEESQAKHCVDCGHFRHHHRVYRRHIHGDLSLDDGPGNPVCGSS